jgi:hypothetical protein
MERFSRLYAVAESGCWLWTGALDRKGYGRFRLAGAAVPAHRAAHVLFIGEIPTRFVIDHLCRNPRCVNPAHLEAVTNRTNVIRGLSAAANRRRGDRTTHCPRGHEYTADNTRLSSKGWRVCRQCEAARHRRNRLDKRGIPHGRRAA